MTLMKGSRLLGVLIAACLFLAFIPIDDEGDLLLENAKNFWKEKKYDQASKAYRKLRDEHPGHDFVKSGDAQFWYWCSLGNAGETKKEIEEIERFLKKHPRHRSCGYALYFLGIAWRKLGDEAKAKKAWDDLVTKYPDDRMVAYVTGRPPKSEEGSTKKRKASHRTPGIDYVDYAKGAAAWLEKTAEEEGPCLKWPQYEATKAHGLNFYDGSAGVCLFFLNMYRILGDGKYADLAKGSARYLMSRAEEHESGLSWKDEDEGKDGAITSFTSPGLYVGAAGIGHVFLCLHEAFNDAAYLDHARGAADWIVASAEEEGDGRHWGKDTDIISGPAGIGLFLLEAHAATGEGKYLACAEGAAAWLISHGEEAEGGLKWKSSLDLDRFYTGLSHGTAGIAYYLARVYEMTGKKEYLEKAKKGASWLMHHGAKEGEGLKWFHYEPRTTHFQTGWCHGPAGTCRLFLKLYDLTKNGKYLEVAEQGARWLMDQGKDSDGSDAPYYYGLSMCCGAAGIGDFFLDLYKASGHDPYLDHAAAIAEHLMVKARAEEGRFSWTNYDQPDEEGKIHYGTGHMIGAAGIGSFFLRLHAFLNNREHLFMSFADKPSYELLKKGMRQNRYAVLSNLPKSSPFFKAAEKLLKHHKGVFVPFQIGSTASLRRRLAWIQPRYAAVVLKPEDIDVNVHRDMLALSARMDDDPFCDFAFGFVTGPTAKDASAMMARSFRIEKKGPAKTRVSASVVSQVESYTYDQEQSEFGYESKVIYWACVEDDKKVMDFVETHIKDIEEKGIVELYGCGDPEGIWLFHDTRNMDRSKHWRFDPEKVGWDPKGEMPRIVARQFRGLKLGGAVVWSGTCHSGVLHRAFVEGDIVSTFGTVDEVTEYIIPKGRSLGLAILTAGPSAFMAPIGPNHGYSCDIERYRALSTGMPLGDVMRTRYNEIIFAAGGKPDIKRYEPGAPHLRENPMRGGGVNRLLYGDPLFKPFPDSGTDYLEISMDPLEDRNGIRVTCEVRDTDSGMFWDMFGDDRENAERIYALAELPEAFKRIGHVSARARTPEGEGVRITAPCWMVEEIDGKRVAHLQVNSERGSLKKAGIRVEFILLPRGR